MKTLKNFIKKVFTGKKKLLAVFLLFFLIFQIFPVTAQAQEAESGIVTAGKAVASAVTFGAAGFDLTQGTNFVFNGIWLLLTTILSYLIAGLGQLLTGLLWILSSVLHYKAFRTSEEVIIGWQIVRDIMNSFFIVVLIAIAISTIIRWKPFDFRTALPRFVIAAIIVNFSRTICLFAISFSQVLMTTFATKIDAALPALILGLRIPSTLALDTKTLGVLAQAEISKTAIQWPTVLLSQIFGVIVITLSLVGIFFFVALLLFRIIILWILMILSPLAFFLWGVPGKGYAYFEKWKDEFIKQILVGPATAFFLYIIILFSANNAANNYGFEVVQGKPAFGTVISSPTYFFGFMVTFGLMMVSVEAINQIGARGTGAAWGLTKGTGRFLRSIDRKIYGATGKTRIPIPTYTAFEQAAGAIQRGWRAKDQANIIAGQQARNAKARELESGGAGFRGLAVQLAAGNAEVVKDLGLFSGEGSLRKRAQNLAFAVPDYVTRSTGYGVSSMSKEGLANWKKEITNREVARNFGQNLAPELANLPLGEVDNKTEEVNQELEKLKTKKVLEEERLRSLQEFAPKLQAIESLEQSGRYLSQDELEQIDAFRDEYGYTSAADVAQGISSARSNIEQTNGDIFNYQKQQEDLKDVKSVLKAAGQSDTNATLDDNFGKIERTAQENKDDARKDLVSAELRARRIRSAKVGDSFNQQMREKEQKYRRSNYGDREEIHSIDEITTNLRSNWNSKNIEAVIGDVMEAAEQGGFDNALRELNPEFTMDDKGLKEFKNALENDVKMTSYESGYLLSRVQARARNDHKPVMSALAKQDESGDYQLLVGTKRNAIIKRNFQEDVRLSITKGKHDGLGVRGEDGVYRMHPAIAEGIKESLGEVENVLKDFKASSSKDTWRMIADEVEKQKIQLSREAREGLDQKLRTATE